MEFFENENKQDINFKNKEGSTLLMFVCEHLNIQDFLDIITLLLIRGAKVNEINNYGETSLMIASAYGMDKIVKVLLAHNASLSNKYKNHYIKELI